MARNNWKLPRFFDRKALPRKVSHTPQQKVLFEALEPRILLSADLMPGAADALAGGLDQFDDRLDLFLDGETLLSERVPMLLTVGTDSAGDPVYEAPTIGELFSIAVDANGDGEINSDDLFDLDADADDDETVLDGWDTDDSGVVETGEFLNALFFGPVTTWLDANPSATREAFIGYLHGLDGEPNSYLDQLSDGDGEIIYTVDFEIFESDTVDLTQDPYLDPHAYDALNAFSVRFALTITQTLPIDLGLEADALKLLAFKGDAYDPQLPTVPVTSTLNFGFDFGVLTGGQTMGEINAWDFFIRSADPLKLSVAASADPMGFHFNVGFLGADVVNGSLDLQADIVTDLLDPNDPDVLGFTDSQHGAESTSGVVAAANSLPSYDLAHDAGFFLRIGNVGINTPVTVDDTGAVNWGELKIDIDEALSDAGLTDLISVNLDATNHVVFTLAGQTDTPLGFANESYGPAGTIQATPDGDSLNQFEYTTDQTLLLSVGGELPTLVTVHFPDPAQEDIGFGPTQTATFDGTDWTLAALDAAAPDLRDQAQFRLILTFEVSGTPIDFTFLITVADNDRTDSNSLAADIAGAIEAALGGDLIDVSVSGDGKIVLTTPGLSNFIGFRISAINLTIDDLILDVNRAFATAGLGTAVTASTDGTHLVLTAGGGKSLEISRTLTLDAGVTYAELWPPVIPGFGTSTEDLFDPSKGDSSHVELRLPVVVADGLKDAQTEAMWKPADVVIVGNFSPFDSDSDIATYDDQLHRFNLEFSFDPLTSVPEQDTPVAHDDVPASTDLTDEIRLVNMAELLNFNLVTAEGMVGLIQGLGTALQQIANSGLYAGYDIPFADASLADLVNYTDSDNAAFSGLIDMLLFDTGGDGIDGTADADRLVKKVLDSEGNSYLIPAFTTAQALGSKLQELLGVTANPTYHKIYNELTYEVSLVGGSRTTVAFDDTPAQYDVDLSPFSKLTLDAAPDDPADLQVALTGYTGLDMTFGINLSPPGAVILPETKLEQLNGGAGVDVKTEHALTGATGVYINYGLSRTSDFWIGIDGSPWIPVRILASDTIVNPTLSHLIDDLNDALDSALQTYDTAHGTAYYGKAEFSYAYAADGSKRLTLEATGGAGTVVLDAASTDPMMAEMGFVFDGYVRPVQTGRFEPLPLYGRLSMDASFDIDVVGTQTVTVTSTATAGNKTIADLVADVDNALVAAGLGGLIKAGYDVSSTQGTRLVLSAIDPIVQFTVGNANSIAQQQLGLPAGTTAADNVDFVIYGSDGHKYLITLDSLSGSSMVGQLIAEINAQIDAQVPPEDWDGDGDVEGAVVAAYNATRTGLRLTDNVRGTEPFRVETINGSKAILTLGFFGAGNQGTQNQFGDGDPYLIEGGQIGETHLDERFFVRDAQMWGGLALQLPDDGVPGTALFGMVGVDTDLTGSLYAEFSAEIKNPLTGVAGGTATLLQLFEGQKQGRLTEDATFEVKFDTDADWVTVTVAKDATNNTLADLVVDVNAALEAASLDSRLVAEASGTRIEFVSRLVNVRGTPVNEAAFSIRANDVGAAEMGLAGTLVSDNVEGIEIVAAHSASRYAVGNVNVSADELYELPVSGYTVLNSAMPFAVGEVLYGWDLNDNVQTTDTAIIVGIDIDPATLAGKLILARVNGDFASAEIVFQDFGINGAARAGALMQRASFGDFTLRAVVQDGFDDPGFVAGDGTHGFGLLDGKSYNVAFDITDFGNHYDPAPPVATFDDLVGQTVDLYAFKDLGYDDVSSALQGLLDILVDVNSSFDLLTLKLPAINRSVSDLLNLVSGFERGVETMDEVFAAALAALDPDAVDLPPLTLQDIPNALRGAFGMPDVAPGDFDWVTLDFDKGDAGDPSDGMLLVDMNLHEALDTKLGLDITVSETLPNLTSAGVLKVNGTLDVNLSFGIDLKHPNDAWLFDNSSIVADVHVEGEAQVYETTDGPKDGMGLVFRASIGPLAVFIQDGDAVIDVAFTLPGLDFGLSDRKLLSTVVYADWEEPVITENYAEIVLPMFYGGEGPDNYRGDFTAKGTLVDDPATAEVEGSLVVIRPDFSDIEADITSGAIPYDPFENILLGIDTLNLYLELLSDTLAGEVLGITMPFVGDQMADVLFIENFRQNLYSSLKSNIENDINPTPDDVTYWLGQALAGYLIDADENGKLIDFATDTTSENIASWFHQWNFTLQDVETVIFENFDLGIPNLGFDSNIPVKAELTWTFSLGFGLNFVEGAYIDVAALEDLDLDLKFTLLPQSDSEAMLGFLKGPLTDPNSDTGAVLNFDIDITNGGDPVKRLGFADIGKLDVATTVVGESLGEAASTDPLIDTNVVTLHLATVARYGLPALAADLVIDWALPAGTKVGDLKGNAVTPDLPGAGVDYIAMMNMEMDSGSIAESLLEPLLGEILYYIDPFMPVVDVLTAPIPVLSDLAGEPFTLLDLAGIFGSVDPEFIDAVADILDVVSMIDEAMDAPVLSLGNIVLFDRANSIESFDPYDAESRLEDVDLISAPGLSLDAGFNNNQGNKFLEFIRATEPPVEGLSTPIYTDPLQAIGLFLNQNATMIDYLLPPLGVEFEYLQVFPIWGPLAVSIEISFGFTVDLHSIGFDTYGYQRYADGGFRNPVVMFDGFYFNDLDTDGVDAPEVTFEFGLVGAAELNLGIARAGVGGGINASIYFDWYDAIPDGHVHISELIANVETAIPGPNPLAVFDIGGALTFQLFAFLEISILGIEEEFPITPETELLSFEETFDHEPVWATDIEGGNLLLNIGPNSRDRIYGDISDGSETVSVTVDAANNVTVEGKNYGVFSNIIGIGGQGDDIIALTLDPASTITYELDGGLGDDTITITGGTGKGVIIGGVGNDRLTGGDGNDEIYGGEGNDTIQGSGGHDILFGDQGRVVDSAYVATPYITSRVTLYDGVDEIHGGSGDDVIIGAGGDDRLWGDAGDDIVIGDGGRFEFEWVTNSDPHVDVASLRPAAYVAEEIDTPTPTPPAEISAAIDAIYDALMTDFHATDLFYGGNDEIYGGADNDMLFGGSGDDELYGDGGDDMILAGKGFDEVFGGAGDDTIFGGDQADVISGDADNDVIAGGSGNDYIHGNAGNDVMKGDSGADVMFGDEDDDQVFGLTEPDILFGGVGDDLVVGGTGNDTMFGDDGLVAKLDPNDGTKTVKIIYNDLVVDLKNNLQSLLNGVIAAEGDYVDDDVRTVDLILTYLAPGDGDDFLSGEAADDIMLGGGGNDTMGGDVDPRLPSAGGPTDVSEDVLIGDGGMVTFDLRRFRSISSVIVDPLGAVGPAGEFDDTIYGDNGDDYLFGGWGSDYLFGGHGSVVYITLGYLGVGAYRGATDEGASDADIIFGDNGRLSFAAYSAEHPDNFGLLTQAQTTDMVETTGKDDYAEGELDNDIVFGGVNNDDDTDAEEVDRLFGHEGRDVVLGDNGIIHFDMDADANLGTLDQVRSLLDKLGGTDEVSGSEEYDLLMGGTGGDRMYGDDTTASSGGTDGNDIMLGDNGQVDLLDAIGPGGAGSGTDLLVFFGGAVVTVNTTDGDTTFGADPNDASTGGVDTMYGNYGDDRIAGGAWGDFLYGSVGDDLILGDAARFEWLYDGSVVTTFELSQNGLLATFDDTFTTLDLVTTKQPTFGGRDTIDGEAGEDTAFGGKDADVVRGGDNDDILFGDHGHFYPQHSTLAYFASRNFFAIDWLNVDGGDGDQMFGDAGDDSMYGQQGDDRMWGGAGDDDMAGGHNVPTGIDEITTGKITTTLNPPVNDLMDGGIGNDAMAGDNAIIWRRGDSATPDDLSPRFRVLTEDTIYSTTVDAITANIGLTWESDPADADGRDITMIDHSDAIEAMPAGARPFGNDVMAGGADSDTMFGELGNDLMQGDGAIETTPVEPHLVEGYPAFISRTLTVDDIGSNPDTDQTLYFNILEQGSDADDYLEGNGGSDLMYGGLGQDDMIGGSSALFGLTTEVMRPDTTDYIYGGAGIDTDRNTIGATTFNLATEDGTTHIITTAADGHARDADYIMGDNANIYRLVNAATDAFLGFNYDNDYGMQLIPHAMQELDYTLGGANYAGGSYANGAANADNGAADLIHGESGDDIIFGMTGSDVLFGEGQDDDIVGGYGHDWISGGTGQDGILGDDGLIHTSRNSTAGEPLNSVAGLLDKDPQPKYAGGNVLDETIATPGSIQYAVINLTGELKKTLDLVPFSYDPAWDAMDDEFPDNQNDSPYADDIIFGGLGTDWLHGGSGDDAISGAEALAAAYVPVYDANGVPTGVLDLGYDAVDLDAATIEPGITEVEVIPGDVLAFNPEDIDGQHLNNRYRAGEFALYNEYFPRNTILLVSATTDTTNVPIGSAYRGQPEATAWVEFLLNFDESEGVVRDAGTVPKATGQQTESYPAVNDDGKDAIFGDLGNDWLVGGTGRDNLYGGWGNDLLNADDDHDGHADVNQLNDFTDTHPYYEDRAYGGAGRDVLIGNTGGDRLIDWVGEYNSYLVPYAPFGQASVSRTLQPFLPEFLYALSAGDGADPTRPADTGADPLRNGEPDAEMGLVLQKDFAWQDQTGAPADPQAGNIPGGARDVLRSATFNDGTTQGFVADSGKWSLKSGVFYVEPAVLGTDAVSVWYHDQVVPSYFELTATVNPVKPIAGYKANAYIVFDYYGPDDFKFAGLNSSTNKIEIGQRTAEGWQVLTSINMLVKAGTNYNLLVALNGTTATIMVNNGLTLSYSFAPHLDVYGLAHNISEGMVGLGADNAKASIDNVSLRVLPPAITLTRTDDFSTAPVLLSDETGTWSLAKGYYVGTPATGESLALAGGDLTIGPAYLLQLETKFATKATGGIVFDQYDVDDFKWAAYSRATNQILIGHYTARDGWVVDNAVTRLLTGEVTMSVTLKGTTASVLVNGVAALSHVYNSVVTDGSFGLFAMDGPASFNTFTVKTDDPAFAQAVPAAALMAAAAAPATTEPADAISAVPTELVDAAKAYWQNVLGAEAMTALDGVTVAAADLNGLLLGQTVGSTIQVDLDGAGYGWFVDATPEDSAEFLLRGGHGQGVGHDTFTATKQSAAAGHMDLLTVLTHEMGHLLGFDHDASWSVMDDDLDAGTRILPKKAATVAAPGKTVSMAANETLVFDEGQGAFHDLLQGTVRNWTDGRAGQRGVAPSTDRHEEEPS